MGDLPKFGEVWGRRSTDDGRGSGRESCAIPPFVVVVFDAGAIQGERQNERLPLGLWHGGEGWYSVELTKGQRWRAPCGCTLVWEENHDWRRWRNLTPDRSCDGLDSNPENAADLIRAGWTLVEDGPTATVDRASNLEAGELHVDVSVQTSATTQEPHELDDPDWNTPVGATVRTARAQMFAERLEGAYMLGQLDASHPDVVAALYCFAIDYVEENIDIDRDARKRLFDIASKIEDRWDEKRVERAREKLDAEVDAKVAAGPRVFVHVDLPPETGGLFVPPGTVEKAVADGRAFEIGEPRPAEPKLMINGETIQNVVRVKARGRIVCVMQSLFDVETHDALSDWIAAGDERERVVHVLASGRKLFERKMRLTESGAVIRFGKVYRVATFAVPIRVTMSATLPRNARVESKR